MRTTTVRTYLRAATIIRPTGLSVGVSLPIAKIESVLSLSSGFSDTYRLLRTSYVFHTFSTYKAVGVSISPFDPTTGEFSVTPAFSTQVQALPPQYNNTTSQSYRNFISNFGTHFVWYLAYGAEIWRSSSVDTCDLRSETLFDVTFGVEAQFLQGTGQTGGKGSFTSLDRQVFLSSDYHLAGGSVSCSQQLCNWTDVKASLDVTNVAPIEMGLRGIESLVADPVISANIKKAVDFLAYPQAPVRPAACAAAGLARAFWVSLLLDLASIALSSF